MVEAGWRKAQEWTRQHSVDGADIYGDAHVYCDAHVTDAIFWADCEGYQKWAYFDNQSKRYWIQAGCRWFTDFRMASNHWALRDDRPITKSLMKGLKAELLRRGLPLFRVQK